MNVALKRRIAAKECGLELSNDGSQYKSSNSPYCYVVDWKPDINWTHFMYFASNTPMLKRMVVLPNISPKEMFELAISKV